MSDVIQYEGDDIEVNVEILDENGDAISIDDLLELYVYIIQKPRHSIEAKYSKAGTGDYIALIKVTATKYKLWIPADISEDIPGGDLWIEINIAETQAELDSGIQNSVGAVKLAEFRTSQIKTESS
jgi:hypothetical protein